VTVDGDGVDVTAGALGGFEHDDIVSTRDRGTRGTEPRDPRTDDGDPA
jgi:hypothetical protein